MSQKDRQERAETHTYTQKETEALLCWAIKEEQKKKKKESGIVKTLNIMTADEPAFKKKKELDFIIPGIPNMTYAHPQGVFWGRKSEMKQKKEKHKNTHIYLYMRIYVSVLPAVQLKRLRQNKKK